MPLTILGEGYRVFSEPRLFECNTIAEVAQIELPVDKAFAFVANSSGAEAFRLLKFDANSTEAASPEIVVPINSLFSDRGRWIAIPIPGAINVTDFGAVGDGVTDSTSGIQAAFDFSATLGAQGVGVEFPAGVFCISDTIHIRRPVTMFGAGLTGDISPEYQVWSGTEIRYSGAGTALQIHGDLNSNFVHRVFMRDLRVTSTGSGQIGIEWIRCEESEMIDVMIGGTTNNGFSQYGMRAEHFSIVRIEGCIFESNGTGLFLDWDTGGDSTLTVYRCNFYANTNHIKLSGGSSINIEENQMERCQNGILIDNVNAQNKVQLGCVRIQDNLFNNGDGVMVPPGEHSNTRFLKVNATANVLFFLQRLSVVGNQCFMDTAAQYAIEFSVANPIGGNLSITQCLISENLVRTATTAMIKSDVDFVPMVLWNDYISVPLLLSGLHNQLNVEGHVSEVIVGAADANSSVIRLLSAAGSASTPNFIQAGRNSADTQCTVTFCRTGSETSPTNWAAATFYSNSVEFKGSFVLDGILNLTPPGVGATAFTLVNPGGGGSSIWSLSSGSFSARTNLTWAKIYADLFEITGRFQMDSVSVYANNAAAITGGLLAGQVYRTGANPDVLCIVH